MVSLSLWGFSVPPIDATAGGNRMKRPVLAIRFLAPPSRKRGPGGVKLNAQLLIRSSIDLPKATATGAPTQMVSGRPGATTGFGRPPIVLRAGRYQRKWLVNAACLWRLSHESEGRAAPKEWLVSAMGPKCSLMRTRIQRSAKLNGQLLLDGSSVSHTLQARTGRWQLK